MCYDRTMKKESFDLDRAVCAVICRHKGIKARDIARELDADRSGVNRVLYASPLLRELCWQDREYRWHGIVAQGRPHTGLQEFAGYCGTVGEFVALSEEEWLARLTEGCRDDMTAVCLRVRENEG